MAMVIGLVGCAPALGGPQDVYAARARAADAIEVTGYLTASEGYSFLTMTPDTEGPCLGLLPNRSQYADLVQYHGRFVRISGRYEPDGCGGDFICHDTCGPAVLARLDAVRIHVVGNEH
jgi:hypothetical protein